MPGKLGLGTRLVPAHGSPGLQVVGLPKDQGLLGQPLLPSSADGGAAERVLAPTSRLRRELSNANRLTSLRTEGLTAVSK